MSRKQEIYKEILSWALPSARNTLSWFRKVRLFVFLRPKLQRHLASQYAVAEFVHNLYVSILDEEFTDHDIHFLNYQARIYYNRGDEDFDPHYYHFVRQIQELFAELPEIQREKLLWDGPEEDYSWAGPKLGSEWTDEAEADYEEKLRQTRQIRKSKRKNST